MCYVWNGYGNWSYVPIGDGTRQTTKSTIPVPDATAAYTHGSFNTNSTCDINYCYEYVKNAWYVVGLIIPENAKIIRPIVQTPALGGKPGFCEGKYCLQFVPPSTTPSAPAVSRLVRRAAGGLTAQLTTFVGATAGAVPASMTSPNPPVAVSQNSATFRASDYDSDYLAVTDGNYIYVQDYSTYNPQSLTYDFVAVSNVGSPGSLGVTNTMATTTSTTTLTQAQGVDPLPPTPPPILNGLNLIVVGYVDALNNYNIFDSSKGQFVYISSAATNTLPAPAVKMQAPLGQKNYCVGGFCYSFDSSQTATTDLTFSSIVVPTNAVARILKLPSPGLNATVLPLNQRAGYCDTGFCYTFTGASWTATARVGGTGTSHKPSDPNYTTPLTTATVFFASSPYSTSLACDAAHCYEFNTQTNVWQVSAILAPNDVQPLSPAVSAVQSPGYCLADQSWCYNWNGESYDLYAFSGLKPTHGTGLPKLDPVIKPSRRPQVTFSASDISDGYWDVWGGWSFDNVDWIATSVSSSNKPDDVRVEPLIKTDYVLIQSTNQATLTPFRGSDYDWEMGWYDSSNYYVWDYSAYGFIATSTTGSYVSTPPITFAYYTKLPSDINASTFVNGTFVYSYNTTSTSWILSALIPDPNSANFIIKTPYASFANNLQPSGDVPFGWCDSDWCYYWKGWDTWTAFQRSRSTAAAKFAFPSATAPTTGTFTTNSTCDTTYCYEVVSGAWAVVGLVVPKGKRVLRNSYCDTATLYCFEYATSWKVTSLTGFDNGNPKPTVTNPGVPPEQAWPGGVVGWGDWIFTYSTTTKDWKPLVYASPAGTIGLATAFTNEDFVVSGVTVLNGPVGQSPTPLFASPFILSGFSRDSYVCVYDNTPGNMTCTLKHGATAQTAPDLGSPSPIAPSNGATTYCVGVYCYSKSGQSYVLSGLKPPTDEQMMIKLSGRVTATSKDPAFNPVAFCDDLNCHLFDGAHWVTYGFNETTTGTLAITPTDPVYPSTDPYGDPSILPPSQTYSVFTSSFACDDYFCYDFWNNTWGVSAVLIPGKTSLIRSQNDGYGWCDGNMTWCYQGGASQIAVSSFQGIAPADGTAGALPFQLRTPAAAVVPNGVYIDQWHVVWAAGTGWSVGAYRPFANSVPIESNYTHGDYPFKNTTAVPLSPVTASALNVAGWISGTTMTIWDAKSFNFLQSDGNGPFYAPSAQPKFYATASAFERTTSCSTTDTVCYSLGTAASTWDISAAFAPSTASSIHRLGYVPVSAATQTDTNYYPTGYCVSGVCHRFLGWSWQDTPVNGSTSTASSTLPLPNPPTTTSTTVNTTCDATYCYEYIGSVWNVVALVLPPNAQLLRKATSSFADTFHSNAFCIDPFCYKYNGAWTVTRFAGTDPGTTPLNVTLPTLPQDTGIDGASICSANWCYYYEANASALAWNPYLIALPSSVPHETLFTDTVSVAVTPNADTTLNVTSSFHPMLASSFVQTGYVDTFYVYVWDNTAKAWALGTIDPDNAGTANPKRADPVSLTVPATTNFTSCDGSYCFVWNAGTTQWDLASIQVKSATQSLIQRFDYTRTSNTAWDFDVGFCGYDRGTTNPGYCDFFDKSAQNHYDNKNTWTGVSIGGSVRAKLDPTPPDDGTVLSGADLTGAFSPVSYCRASFCYDRIDTLPNLPWRVTAISIVAQDHEWHLLRASPSMQQANIGYCDVVNDCCYRWDWGAQTWKVNPFSGNTAANAANCFPTPPTQSQQDASVINPTLSPSFNGYYCGYDGSITDISYTDRSKGFWCWRTDKTMSVVTWEVIGFAVPRSFELIESTFPTSPLMSDPAVASSVSLASQATAASEFAASSAAAVDAFNSQSMAALTASSDGASLTASDSLSASPLASTSSGVIITSTASAVSTASGASIASTTSTTASTVSAVSASLTSSIRITSAASTSTAVPISGSVDAQGLASASSAAAVAASHSSTATPSTTVSGSSGVTASVTSTASAASTSTVVASSATTDASASATTDASATTVDASASVAPTSTASISVVVPSSVSTTVSATPVASASTTTSTGVSAAASTIASTSISSTAAGASSAAVTPSTTQSTPTSTLASSTVASSSALPSVTPVPIPEIQMTTCCQNKTTSFQCSFGSNACTCSFLQSVLSCAVPATFTPNAGDPTPSTPANGALSVFPPTSTTCDYYYCYVLNGGVWSYVNRTSYFVGAPAPNVPSSTTPVPDAPTPFRPYSYCDFLYCYNRLGSGYWETFYRYGSELMTTQTGSDTLMYGMYYFYKRNKINEPPQPRYEPQWTAYPYSNNTVGLPPPSALPDMLPAAKNIHPLTAVPVGGMYCDKIPRYCYMKNHFNVWVSNYTLDQPADAPGMPTTQNIIAPASDSQTEETFVVLVIVSNNSPSTTNGGTPVFAPSVSTPSGSIVLSPGVFSPSPPSGGSIVLAPSADTPSTPSPAPSTGSVPVGAPPVLLDPAESVATEPGITSGDSVGSVPVPAPVSSPGTSLGSDAPASPGTPSAPSFNVQLPLNSQPVPDNSSPVDTAANTPSTSPPSAPSASDVSANVPANVPVADGTASPATFGSPSPPVVGAPVTSAPAPTGSSVSSPSADSPAASPGSAVPSPGSPSAPSFGAPVPSPGTSSPAPGSPSTTPGSPATAPGTPVPSPGTPAGPAGSPGTQTTIPGTPSPAPGTASPGTPSSPAPSTPGSPSTTPGTPPATFNPASTGPSPSPAVNAPVAGTPASPPNSPASSPGSPSPASSPASSPSGKTSGSLAWLSLFNPWLKNSMDYYEDQAYELSYWNEDI